MATVATRLMLDDMETFEHDTHASAPIDESSAEASPDGPTKLDVQQSRRDAFKKLAIGAAGALAVGGVAAVLKPDAAAAIDGQNITIGNDQQTSQSETAIRYIGADNHNGVFYAIEGTAAVNSSSEKAALNGWVFQSTASTKVRDGVMGYTDKADGFGVVARSNNGIGLKIEGDLANMYLVPGFSNPTTRNVAFAHGTVVYDASGELWLCVVSGTPGKWRKLSGTATAGALHLLDEPLRTFDSRVGPKLAAGSTTTVNLGSGVNGAGATGIAVPVGASAALVNITLTGTVGNFGYIQAYSAALDTPPATSVMNWSTPEDNVANEMTVKVNATFIRVTVGVNATHVITDVVGYYR
jgi:hypothetical protein